MYRTTPANTTRKTYRGLGRRMFLSIAYAGNMTQGGGMSFAGASLELPGAELPGAELPGAPPGMTG